MWQKARIINGIHQGAEVWVAMPPTLEQPRHYLNMRSPKRPRTPQWYYKVAVTPDPQHPAQLAIQAYRLELLPEFSEHPQWLQWYELPGWCDFAPEPELEEAEQVIDQWRAFEVETIELMGRRYHVHSTHESREQAEAAEQNCQHPHSAVAEYDGCWHLLLPMENL